MDVTRSMFEKALPHVERAIEQCHFYAFDLEMTGLHVSDQRESWVDDMEDRYRVYRDGAQSFLITQFGLSCLVWEEGQYQAHTFNFYLFPLPMLPGPSRRFLCDAGSLEFLANQGFDFNKFVYEGVPLLRASDRDRHLSRMDAGDSAPSRPDIPLDKPENRELVDRLIAQVAEWLKGEDSQLFIGSYNSYQRAIQYQQLEKEQFGAAQPPGFSHAGASDENGRRGIKLTRATAEELAALVEKRRQAKLKSILDAAGFVRVFEMLRDSGKPAVGHNCLFDLAFTLEHLAEPLPEQWPAFKHLVKKWFPGGIWDTKLLVKCLPEVASQLESTSLGPLYEALGGADEPQAEVLRYLATRKAEQLQKGWKLPAVHHAPGFLRYSHASAGTHAHEAGFDAYMTGMCFARLMRLHEASAAGPADPVALPPPQARSPEGLEVLQLSSNGAKASIEYSSRQPKLSSVQEMQGRINLMQTDLPHAALWEEDPVPPRAHLLYLSGLPAGSRIGDIVPHLERAGLGRARLHFRSSGTQAIVDFSDRGRAPEATKKQVAEILQLQPHQVLTHAEFVVARQEDSLQKHADGSWGPTGELGSEERPLKRVRQDVSAAAGGVQQKRQHGRLCAVM
ncbi:hypothetical protein CVIRNUC_010834 [Coccomyxa viridis]|uniref:Uncharacterized protein n=1 Tax=Coccomyxa viridis TaxID=1274662 RepID=A0AAV1ILN6_9CHLO|nr:hypothetical protein CVIRNUC_010834 [Coccomyxa viridis]